MGLLKSGLKYGALAYVAKEAAQAFSSHDQEKHDNSRAQSQSPPCDQSSHAPRHAWEPPVYEEWADGPGQYVHQRWCNGVCGRMCRFIGEGKR